MKRSTQKSKKKLLERKRKRKTRLQKRVQKGGNSPDANRFAQDLLYKSEEDINRGDYSWLSLKPTSDTDGKAMYIIGFNGIAPNGKSDRIELERSKLDAQIRSFSRNNCIDNSCKECFDIHSLLMKRWKEIRKVIFLFEQNREVKIMVNEDNGPIERKGLISGFTAFGPKKNLETLADEMNKVLNMYYRHVYINNTITPPPTTPCKELKLADVKLRTNKFYFDRYWKILQDNQANGTCNCENAACVEAVHQLKGLYEKLLAAEQREPGPKQYISGITKGTYAHMDACGISPAPYLSSESTLQQAVSAFQGR